MLSGHTYGRPCSGSRMMELNAPLAACDVMTSSMMMMMMRMRRMMMMMMVVVVMLCCALPSCPARGALWVRSAVVRVRPLFVLNGNRLRPALRAFGSPTLAMYVLACVRRAPARATPPSSQLQSAGLRPAGYLLASLCVMEGCCGGTLCCLAPRSRLAAVLYCCCWWWWCCCCCCCCCRRCRRCRCHDARCALLSGERSQDHHT